MRPEVVRVALTVALLGVLAGCPTDRTARPQTPPADALALERDAAAAYAAGDWQSAADRYAALVELAPRVAESWFRLGNARARLGQTDPAIAAYREALVREPGMVKAWHNMGLTQLREAAATFAQMNQYAGPDDPLRDRAARLSTGVADLLRPAGTVADSPGAKPAEGPSPDAGSATVGSADPDASAGDAAIPSTTAPAEPPAPADEETVDPPADAAEAAPGPAAAPSDSGVDPADGADTDAPVIADPDAATAE